uniref:Uncharacterized protein n=1 Tax=Arion vulgaris TaxID=1028688 RepID=A0A0B7AG92_9EUPU
MQGKIRPKNMSIRDHIASDKKQHRLEFQRVTNQSIISHCENKTPVSFCNSRKWLSEREF